MSEDFLQACRFLFWMNQENPWDVEGISGMLHLCRFALT
jgi:hypothetical protein